MRRRRASFSRLAPALALLAGAGCATPWSATTALEPEPPAASEPAPTSPPERELRVLASAYNSLRGQGQGDATIAAWGDRLRPGMLAIAVSRDLLDLGLGYGTRVRIEGLDGEYVVLDKMHRRWRRKIDLYMGTDRAAALRWGVREVRISWSPEGESVSPPPASAP
jgi:3D (Asp-Asp-Asp) domain-containing protein